MDDVLSDSLLIKKIRNSHLLSSEIFTILLTVLEELKAKNIGLAGFGTSHGDAVVYAITKKPDQLRNAWKASGRFSKEGTGFFPSGTDKSGVLVKSLDTVAKAGVNMQAVQAGAVGGKYGTFIWVDQSDVDRTSRAD